MPMMGIDGYLPALGIIALTIVIGAVAKNENEAIGLGKMLSMVVILSVLGGSLLPDRWQWTVWWSPLYWVYDALEDIFSETADWLGLGWRCGIAVGLTVVFFLLLRIKIVKGLSS